MRILSFIVFILGCILTFSGNAEGFGIALMVIGVIVNILHHMSNISRNRK